MGTKLSFTSVCDENAMLLAMGGQTIFAILVESEIISVQSEIAPVLPAVFAALIVRSLARTLQRVQIDGNTVQVLDMTTCYLWRSFDLAEVERLEYCRGSSETGGAYIKVSLKPDSDRRRHGIRPLRIGMRGNGLLFDAFMSRVQALRPDLEVHKLPSHYRDGPRQERGASQAAPEAGKRRPGAKTGRPIRSHAQAQRCKDGKG